MNTQKTQQFYLEMRRRLGTVCKKDHSHIDSSNRKKHLLLLLQALTEEGGGGEEVPMCVEEGGVGELKVAVVRRRVRLPSR